MKKTNVLALLTVLCILLSGCAMPWSTFQMEEVLPPILDEFTWLPLLDSVTVTRISDGVSVTVSGTDTELLYDCFIQTPCTRRSGSVTEIYTLAFTMCDGADVRPMASVGEYRGTVCISVDGYRYRPVSASFDLAYLEGLFAP